MAQSFIATFLVYLVFLLTQAIVFHFIEIKKRVKTMAAILLASAFLWFPIEAELREIDWLNVGVPIEIAVWSGLLFTLIWFGYLQFWSAFDTSPSLRFLIEIFESEKGVLTVEQLHDRYSFDDVFRRRIDRMSASGFLEITKTGEELNYRNSAKGQKIGRISSEIKNFLNLGEGG